MKSFGIALSVMLLVVGCNQPAPDTDETLTKVLMHFHELKSRGDLPGLAAEATGKLSAFEITPDFRDQIWFKDFAGSVSECNKITMVEVTLVSIELRYLFCLDSGSPTLLGSFQMNQGQWQGIPIAENHSQMK